MAAVVVVVVLILMATVSVREQQEPYHSLSLRVFVVPTVCFESG